MIHFNDIFEGIEQLETGMKDVLGLFADTEELSPVEEGLISGYLTA